MDEKNRKFIIVAVLVAVIAVVVFVALRQPVPDPDPAPTLTAITVSPATVVVGGTHTFRATPVPADARIGIVTWAVADPAIGTITPAGVFTAVAAGTTNVTATYGDITTTVLVTVTPIIDPYPLE